MEELNNNKWGLSLDHLDPSWNKDEGLLSLLDNSRNRDTNLQVIILTRE